MSKPWEHGEEHTECREEIAKLGKQNDGLLIRVAKLEDEIRELKSHLNMNSRNSSRPPSSDPPNAPPRPTKPPTGRQPGGQPGHPGHKRELLEASKVDRVVQVKPQRCAKCGGRLKGKDPAPQRHQVVEVPPIKPEVTEYQLHALTCGCGQVTIADLPRGVPLGILGPRLQATIAYFTGRARMSKRVIKEMLRDLFNVRISLGAIKAAEERISHALQQPVQQAAGYAQAQKVAHVDETGWWQGNKIKAWLWVMVTTWVTIIVIHRKRGFDGLFATVRFFNGYLISDRWFVYEAWSMFKRQLCWAHLLRHFQAFVDSGKKKAREIGKGLLFEAKQMFVLWHRVRDGTLSRKKFQAQLRPIRSRIMRLLKKGARCGHRFTQTTCEDLVRLWPALFTFARVRGIEPTNNAGERAARHAVVYRKCSYGTKSASGSRFIERIFTVVATLRQQNRNVLDFLTRACTAANFGHRPPSLLPTKRVLRATA